jgi:hypothetical protein
MTNGMGPFPPRPQQGPPAPGATAQVNDKTMYERRLAEIQAMPPGPDREAALELLSRDYPGLAKTATTSQEQGFEMAMSPGAKGTELGGRYSTYVAANPLEHLASGLRQYGGYKKMNKAEEQLDQLSKDKQRSLMDMLRAGL